MNATAIDSEHEEGRFVAEAAEAAATLDLDDDAEHEEGRLVEEAAEAAAATAKEKPKRRDAMSENEKISEKDDEIRSLVEEMRNIAKGEKHKLKELSKRIKKCIRERKRAQREGKIQQNLEEFRGIQSISCIKSGRKRKLIPKVQNDKGETITSREGIANVFAETQPGEEAQESQNMETKTNKEKKSCSEDVKNEIPEFTQDEVQAAIENLKKVKQVTALVSGPRTSRLATQRRKKCSGSSSTKC